MLTCLLLLLYVHFTVGVDCCMAGLIDSSDCLPLRERANLKKKEKNRKE